MPEIRNDATIHLHLLPTADGGRKSTVPSHVWKCRLKIADRFYDARLTTKDGSFSPGGEVQAEVAFLDWDSVSKVVTENISVGVWELHEVGAGRIGQILNRVSGNNETMRRNFRAS